MAVVSRIASLRIQVAVENGRHRTWTATAATQDTAPGGSVIVTVARAIGFTGSPDEATTLELRYYRDDGTLIRSFTLNPAGTFPQTDTFHFTDTGAVGGSPRAGTVEIAIYAKREPVAGTIIYEVETDATPNNPGTGNQSLMDRGWVRTTLEATAALSNVALGGAKNSPAAHPDSLHVRVTLNSALYVARALTVAVSGATPALSAATNAATSGNFDATFANAVDDRFPAAATVATTSVAVPNSTLTGLPFVALTATNDSMTVDPRPAVTHHYQVEDDVFGLAKHEASNSMADDESSFLWSIVKNARGEGINGLTVTQALDPVRAGDTISQTSATSTQNGQAGVTGFLAWVAAKPTGQWNKRTDITAPATIDSDAHLLNPTQSYVMRKVSSDYVTLAGGGPTVKASHFSAGMEYQAGMIVLNVRNAQRQPIDADAGGDLAYVALVRLQDAGPNAGLSEYLGLDDAWKPLPAGSPLTEVEFHRVTQTLPGSGVYLKTWTAAQTQGWGDHDIFVLSRVRIDSSWYGNYMQTLAVGKFNDHAKLALDPTGLYA